MNVLLTGGSRGIGKAVGEVFLKHGYNVISPTREEMDLSSNASIQAYIEQNEHLEIDVLINNAGINPLSSIDEMKDEDLAQCIQVNLTAPALLCRGFVPGMKKRRNGRIVNIGSIWSVVSKEKRSAYAMTKNGIHGLTNTLAVELGSYNILVNTVCPGFTKTELTAQNISAEVEKQLNQDIPLGRFATPEEIANIVFLLGSEHNTYITGQKIVADGGFSVR